MENDLTTAQKAISSIIAEANIINDYLLADEFAIWYNKNVKTRIRAKVIIENCNTIINCMERIAKEKGLD